MARWRATVGGGLVGLVVVLGGPAEPAAAQKAKAKADVPPLNARVLEFA